MYDRHDLIYVNRQTTPEPSWERNSVSSLHISKSQARMFGDCQVMSNMGGNVVSSDTIYSLPIENPSFNFMSSMPFHTLSPIISVCPDSLISIFLLFIYFLFSLYFFNQWKISFVQCGLFCLERRKRASYAR